MIGYWVSLRFAILSFFIFIWGYRPGGGGTTVGVFYSIVLCECVKAKSARWRIRVAKKMEAYK